MHKSGFVNIIGNPNVGKSTLMNALVGERLSIITSKAQTTRHRILGIVNGDDFQIVYSDTPGILKPNYKLHESMMKVVQETASNQREETVQVQVEDAFGPVLLQKKHPVLKEWLQRELQTVDTVCCQLAAQPENERITIRMAQVQEKRQLILEALKRYETADV